ncbi:MAG TPA: hypothetical protein VJN96_26465 [Vicinamibacterales bacterium]|nr:hypothetical protein [Vicinamibacterales bacterium]
MRTWVKVTITGVVVVGLGIAAIAGTSAYFFLRHLDTKQASEADTLRQFDALRARFGSRPPLVDIVDLRSGDIRINRTPHPEGRRATTLHVLTWNSDGDRLQSDLPLWLMRFSSVNILSTLGLAPDKYRLTAEDVARYGPGIVAEVRQPGRADVMIWIE